MEEFGVDAGDLRVSLCAVVSVDSPEFDDEIEQWRAELLWRPTDDVEQQVATAGLLVVADRVAEPALALDALNSETAAFARMFDGAELEDSLDAEGFAGVVIVDRVEVVSAMRGHGFGPLLVAEALHRLGRGCAIAACSDSPLGADGTGGADRASIRRMIRDFGFVEWQDGIWTLDLATTVLDATRLAIREARFRVAG